MPGSLARHTHRDAHLAGVVGRRAVSKGCRHSGPQGKAEPLTIIDDPADWKASDWEGRESEYTYRFTSEVCGRGQLGLRCRAVRRMNINR